MGALIVAGIGALLGMTSGILGTVQQGKEEWKKADKEQDFIQELYGLQTQKAKLDFEEAQKQAQKNADEANRQADIADKEADYQDKLADVTDLAQDLNERALSNDFNTAIDNLYLSQMSDTWSYNNASMQAGSSQGAALASVAASGIRAGSSLSDAVLMESAVNESQLQFSQDAKRRSDDNNLASVLNGLAGNRLDIMSNRMGADWQRTQAGFTRDNAAVMRQNALDLVNSYMSGGYNYNVYQNQLSQMEKTYNHNYSTLQDEKEKWWKNGKIAKEAWLAGATNMLGMGSKGMTTGYNLYDTAYKAANYKTK